MNFELFHDVVWKGNARLPAWAGFQDRSGAYGGLGDAAVSDGSVSVMLGPEGRNTEPVTEAERQIVERIVAADTEVAPALLAQLSAAYPVLREGMIAAYCDEIADDMPEISDPHDLKPMIGLHTLHVPCIVGDGEDFVGYEFGCTWEDEHGLGVLMLGNRMVRLGHANEAFTYWMLRETADALGVTLAGPGA